MPSTAWDNLWTGQFTEGAFPLEAPTLQNHLDRDKIRFILPHIARQGRAIEIGCGSARLLARLGLTRQYELTAVDSSLEALKGASQTSVVSGVSMHLVCADAAHLPAKSGSFDVVLSGGLLEHFHDPVPLLKEMVRILRPGGLLYADIVPRKLSLYRVRELVRMIRSEELLPGVYETRYGAEYYRERLVDLDCVDISFEYRGVYPPYGVRHLWKLTRILDGTLVARLLGWYFVLRCMKR